VGILTAADLIVHWALPTADIGFEAKLFMLNLRSAQRN
jgi:hypothetical protein